jgi:hypothetical protein
MEDIEAEDVEQTAEIVAKRRAKQERLMAQKDADRDAKEKADANSFMAAGRLNQGHAMMFSTMAIAFAYMLASTMYTTDILSMPKSTSRLKGTIKVGSPGSHVTGIPQQGIPMQQPAGFGNAPIPTAGSPFGGAATGSPFGGAPAVAAPSGLAANFARDGLNAQLWESVEGSPGPPYQCSFSGRAVVAQPNQALMLGTFAEQYSCFSGQLKSRQAFGHGCFRAALQPAKASGVITGFMAQNKANNQHIEVSLQFRGTDTTTLQVLVWNNGQVVGQQAVPLGFDAATAPATYALAWSAQGVEVIAQGQVVYTMATAAGAPVQGQMHAVVESWAVDASASHVAGAYNQQPAVSYVHGVSVSSDASVCRSPLA